MKVKIETTNRQVKMPSFYEDDVDGVRLHYEKVGTGPQVLLLIPGAIGE